MTREEALSQLAGTWTFAEVNGLIAVREVQLIEALRAQNPEYLHEASEFVSRTPTAEHWFPR